MAAHQSALIANDIEAYLAEHERKGLLRLLTCGSVDDGKSTLIGRLLHDAGMIYADHLAALESDSASVGTTGDRPDLALLMDGLQAEREQGITIDVAYRYFSTARRKFVIADTPGHVQYTRNMVTGASTAELAIILVDARHGIVEQTRRHRFIASLLGIRRIVVAVNKMDLVGYAHERFAAIRAEYERFAAGLDPAETYVIPICALEGDNVVAGSTRMPWFDVPPLLEHLETVDVAADADLSRLRFPVQLVTRPDRSFRGFAGTVAAGLLRPGQEVLALPSGVRSRVARIVTYDGDLEVAGPGRAVTVTLTDEIDVSRGDLLVDPVEPPQRAHDLDADVVWLTGESARVGRQYLLHSVNGPSNATVAAIHHRVDVNTRRREPADELAVNDIARVTLRCDRELAFDTYAVNRTTGSFVLIDRLTNATVAAGMIAGVASGWERVPPAGLAQQDSPITAPERAARLRQQPATVLITGMTGAGKSTIAAALERRLFDRGATAVRLDGQNLRLGISRDLGFAPEDRSENLRRAAEIAALMARHGLITIVAVQAPEAAVRERVRDLLGEQHFLEVHVDADEQTRRARDPRGLYAAADRGELSHLPGVTSRFDTPVRPDLHLDTGALGIAACVERIIDELDARGLLAGG
ncbi:MAG TPA: sulfate adenylyltransferase subunit CysN [Egicoccus sp.]|nr:sulfate adenylyltransferase subunit CysN [Egicoccus sp.]HSK22846.1 sulfate adenylyltransferase subunit CysN [Egicoccus sp.]